MTDKKHPDSNIWPETPQTDTDIKDIIRTIWYKKAMKQRKIHLQQQLPSSLSVKKACYISYTSSNLINRYVYLVTDT